LGRHARGADEKMDQGCKRSGIAKVKL